MTHIKGYRFGFPAVQRLGLIDDAETHRIKWNAHEGLEIHYVLRGRFTWEIRRRRDPLVVPGGYFVIIPAARDHRAAGETGTPSHRLGVILEPFSKSIARGSSLSADELKDVFGTMSAHALELRPLTPERTCRESAAICRSNVVDADGIGMNSEPRQIQLPGNADLAAL